MKLKLTTTLLITFFYSSLTLSKNTLKENISLFYQEKYSDQKSVEVLSKDLTQFIATLTDFQEKSEKKKIKHLTKSIENKYFKQQNNTAGLAELYKYGRYNPINALAITAIIFEELDIPYELYEIEEHLELYAFPAGANIQVEYTSKMSLLPWNVYTKTEVINYLISMDIITLRDADTYNYQLITRYFSNSSPITLKQLAGLDLMKRGLIEIERSKYLQATELLKTGNKLYPNERFRYLLYGAISETIEDLSFSDIRIIDYLLTLYEISEKQASLERVNSNLLHIYYLAYEERHDTVFMDSTQTLVLDIVKPPSKRNSIMSDLLQIDAYYLWQKDRFADAFETAREGLTYNPDNLKIHDMFFPLLIEKSLDDNFYLNDYDGYLDTINYYVEQYDFLKNRDDVFEFKILIKANEIQSLYLNNSDVEGAKLLSELEELIKEYNYKEEKINKEIALAYSEVGNYYYRQKEYETALEWTNKALKVAPNSASILRRKAHIQAQYEKYGNP